MLNLRSMLTLQIPPHIFELFHNFGVFGLLLVILLMNYQSCLKSKLLQPLKCPELSVLTETWSNACVRMSVNQSLHLMTIWILLSYLLSWPFWQICSGKISCLTRLGELPSKHHRDSHAMFQHGSNTMLDAFCIAKSFLTRALHWTEGQHDLGL